MHKRLPTKLEVEAFEAANMLLRELELGVSVQGYSPFESRQTDLGEIYFVRVKSGEVRLKVGDRMARDLPGPERVKIVQELAKLGLIDVS